MIESLEKCFEKFDDEFLKFDRIENPICNRPDLCAFLRLENIVKGNEDIVVWAGHDEIALSINPEDLTKLATEEDILYLIRCGVRYGDDYLRMYV